MVFPEKRSTPFQRRKSIGNTASVGQLELVGIVVIKSFKRGCAGVKKNKMVQWSLFARPENGFSGAEKRADPFFHSEEGRVTESEERGKIGGRTMRTQNERNVVCPGIFHEFFPAPVRPGVINNEIRFQVLQKVIQILL